ncbi:type II toxin-antitoxin system RelE/ParE family toxin [Chloroflexota bacterium]
MGELQFDPDALSGVPKPECERILEKAGWLWEFRSIVTHHPLRHDLSGLYKRLLGKYRIIYSYEEAADKMVIHLVGTRDTIYKNAVKKFRK